MRLLRIVLDRERQLSPRADPHSFLILRPCGQGIDAIRVKGRARRVVMRYRPRRKLRVPQRGIGSGDQHPTMHLRMPPPSWHLRGFADRGKSPVAILRRVVWVVKQAQNLRGINRLRHGSRHEAQGIAVVVAENGQPIMLEVRRVRIAPPAVRQPDPEMGLRARVGQAKRRAIANIVEATRRGLQCLVRGALRGENAARRQGGRDREERRTEIGRRHAGHEVQGGDIANDVILMRKGQIRFPFR